MADRSQENSKYNEEMRQWMAKQTFWHRMKYGRHPGDRSKLASFLTKAFIVLLVMLAVALVAYAKLLSRQVGSAGFANHLKHEVAQQMGARAVEGSGVSWDSGVARMKELNITGGRSNFFTSMEIERLNFPLEYMDVIKGEVKFGKLEMSGVDMKLRSGAFTDREWQELLGSEDVKEQAAGGGWLTPALDLDGIREIDIRDFSASWGAKSWMSGSLTDCKLDVMKRDGTWKVLIDEGKFSQNWIQDADIQKMELEIDSSAIRITEAQLVMPSGSELDITGIISLGDDPEFNLNMVIEDFQFADFIREEWAMILAGEFHAEIQMTGSINRNKGLVSKGRLLAEPEPGSERNGAIRDSPWLVKFGRKFDSELSVFRAFGDVLGADGIRYFTSERTVIDFETSRGNLKVTNMQFEDPMVGKMRGFFTYDGKSESITEGELVLTLEEKVFEGNRELRETRSILFEEGAGGLSQFFIELKGSVNVLTEMDAQRVKKAATEIDG